MERKEAVKEPVAKYGDLYTYADYLRWEFEERLEILRGKIFTMSPAPGTLHQKISLALTREFLNVFKKNEKCQVFVAPFDVRLIDPKKKSKKDKEITTVCQPDICVICDENKIDERGGIGAPDLVVEILSPGNTKKEMGIKFELYEENGVREYWMVDPSERVIFSYVLEGSRFVGKKPTTVDEVMQSAIFPDLQFKVSEIFPNE